MTKKLKILAIVGSLRKNSYNRQLATLAGDLVKEKADFSILDYTEVPFFNQDIEYPAPDSVSNIRNKVKSADGIWFFVPEYNHYFSGVLKNLLDWLSRPISKDMPQVLFGKPAAISGITPGLFGTSHAQDHLVTLISFLNMDIMNFPRLTIPNVLEQVNQDDKLILSTSYPFLESQANAFIDFLKNKK